MLRDKLHTHINSAVLQRRHPSVYEDMFHACPVVVSVPLSLVWSPNYAVGPGGLGIVSKLPARAYVGVEPTAESGVQFGPFKYYIPESDTFEEWKDTTRTPPLFSQILDLAAKKVPAAGGARLWGITELPWYRGLNMEAHTAVAVSSAWLVQLGIITAEDIQSFILLAGKELMTNKAFDTLFRFSWKLESILINDLADGHVIANSLIDAEYPVVFFREPDPFLFGGSRDFGPEHPSSYYNVMSTLNYSIARLDELFSLDPTPTWPVDAVLVHIGECGDGRNINQVRKAYANELDAVASMVKETFQNTIPQTFTQPPKFLRLTDAALGSSPGVKMYQSYRESSIIHSLSVLKTIRNLFEFGAAPHILREFINGQNLCQDILRILGLSTLPIDQAETTLRFLGAQKTAVGVSARLIGLGGHGALMAVGPQEQLEQCIEEASDHLAQSMGRQLHCHWASWCDGMRTTQGLRIEQDIRRGRYSHFTTQSQLTIFEFHRGLLIGPRLVTLDQWQKEAQSFDVIFNDREKKIYVRGEPLTSRDIHSAKQTNTLIRQFLACGTSELEATELLASCYRSDRNQMDSKIVRPINQIVKNKTGHELGLKVHGGLGSKYIIRFAPHKRLRIGFIEADKRA